MIVNLLSSLDTNEQVKILRLINFELYINSLLKEEEINFLKKTTYSLKMGDYELSKIFNIDTRYNLEYKELFVESKVETHKLFYFFINIISIINNGSLKERIKKTIKPQLPFSEKFQNDLEKLAKIYIESSEKLYDFIYDIEDTSWIKILSKQENNIPKYDKLFIFDKEKINNLSSRNKEAFFHTLIYLMLNDNKIDELEKYTLYRLAFILDYDDVFNIDIDKDISKYKEINISILSEIGNNYIKKLLLFSFIISRKNEKLNDFQSDRFKIVNKLLNIEEDLNKYFEEIKNFKQIYIDVIEIAFSSLVAEKPDKNTLLEYIFPIIGKSIIALLPQAKSAKIIIGAYNILTKMNYTPTNYEIINLNDKKESDKYVICIDGFLSEHLEEQFKDWSNQIEKINPNIFLNGYTWPAGSFNFLKANFNWFEAINNTVNTANKLAYEIEQIKSLRPNLKIILMGHSLGGRVIYNTLLKLHSKNISIYEAYIFGGAVSRENKAHWTAVLSSVENKLYNFYSNNDEILKKLYQISMLGDKPTGLGEISCHELGVCSLAEVVNIDASNIVKGHTEYKNNLKKLFDSAKLSL